MSDEHIFVVDDDSTIRDSLRLLLEAADFKVRTFNSAKAFIGDEDPKRGCLICDIRMPEMDGLELQKLLGQTHPQLPIVFMTGFADIPPAVRAMQAGAINFLEKPFDERQLMATLESALNVGAQGHDRVAQVQFARELMATLTLREVSVFDKLIWGQTNKIVAYELGISPRTVEVHRANIMRKMKADSISDLVRIALMADQLQPIPMTGRG
jgi:two-component system response regulator FixJ